MKNTRETIKALLGWGVKALSRVTALMVVMTLVLFLGPDSVVGIGASPAVAQTTGLFEAIELKPLQAGGGVTVEDINDRGDVIGTAYGPEATIAAAPDEIIATIWRASRGGLPERLAVLPSEFSVGLGINDTGLISGAFHVSNRSGSGFHNQAALWRHGAPVLLPGPLAPPDPFTRGNAVNDLGQVVGSVDDRYAVLWESSGSLVPLPTLGGSIGIAHDINNLGTIVGLAATPGFQLLGVVWERGTVARVLAPLPGDTRSRAAAINDTGDVVGTSAFDHPVRWPAGTSSPVALAGLPGGSGGDADDINNLGLIVGSARNASHARRAVLWLDDSTVVDLNDLIAPSSGWVLETALAINDAGWIIGSGRRDSRFASFLLRPVERRPVIVIPGVMGTTLLEEQFGPDDLIWLDINEALLSVDDAFLERLELDAAGQSIFGIRTGEIFDGSFFANVYGELIEELEDAGYEEGVSLFKFPYDWRLDNGENARRLESFVENEIIAATGAESVDIVAHSMGGLLTRRYALTRPDRVNKVVYLGTPHLGAPKTFNALAFDDVLSHNFLRVPFLNRHTLAAQASTFPSSYQLLPRFEFIFSVELNRFLTLPESYTTDFLRSDGWIALAESFHHNLAVPLSADQFNIVSSGLPTLGGLLTVVDTSAGQTIRDWAPVDDNGDGTVPLGSAVAVPGAVSTFYVRDVEHDRLAADTCVRELVVKILRDDLDVLPGCVGTSPFPLPLGGFVRWFSASPIRVTITDTQSRVDGVKPDNSIRQEIPRSRFFVFEKNEGGFLPRNEEYLVEVRAHQTGVFSLTFAEAGTGKGLDLWGIELTRIPVAKGALGSFAFTPGGPAPILSLDMDGDGVVDLELTAEGQPTAEVLLDLLRRVVDSLALERGIAMSLLAKVDASQRAVERQDVEGGVRALEALRNEVGSQSGKHISEEDARGLEQIVSVLIARLR